MKAAGALLKFKLTYGGWSVQHTPPTPPIADIVNISVIKKVRDFVIREVSFFLFLIKIMKLILLYGGATIPTQPSESLN